MIADYARLARVLGASRPVFLNYGFADEASRDDAWIRPEDRADRHHLHLVRRVLEGAALQGKDVLEVGCGRGGNCSYIARYAAARRVVGVDSCVGSIAFCATAHRLPGSSFAAGAADRLPLRDARFDLVLNLESAHCYADFGAFLREVRRVLRPGGLFRFADVWGWSVLPIDWSAREKALAACGLVVESDHDISRGVVEALERTDGLATTLGSAAEGRGAGAVRGMIEGARAFRASLVLGLCRYRVWHMVKPAAD